MIFPRLPLSWRFLLAGLVCWLSASLPVFSQSAVSGTLPDTVSMHAIDGEELSLDLSHFFKTDNAPGTVVRFTFSGASTVSGSTIDVALTDDATPVTVANFLSYVRSGEYSRSFIHRSGRTDTVNGPIGIVQGGGFFLKNGATSLTKNTWGRVPSGYPIVNESSPDRPNVPGTIAMARQTAADSATSEWFINTSDNTAGFPSAANQGYTVFGRILGNGLDVATKIFDMDTTDISSIDSSLSGISFVPTQGAVASPTSLSQSQLAIVESVDVITPWKSFEVTSSDPDLITITPPDQSGVVTFTSGTTTGTATITVTATDLDGAETSGSMTLVVGDSNAAIFTTGTDVLQFSGTGSVGVHVLRNGGPGRVYYTTAETSDDRRARAGTDFVPTSGTLIFSAGGSNDQTVHISLLGGPVTPPSKDFTLQLSSSTSMIGYPSFTTIQLADPSLTPGGVIQFTSSGYLVDSGNNFAVVGVSRSGGTSGTVSAVLSTSDDSAITGTHYTGMTRTVTFQPGDPGPQYILIPILDSTDAVPFKSFNLFLSSPSTTGIDSVTLGALSQSYVSIQEKHAAGGVFNFIMPEFWSVSNPGVVTVQRLGSTAQSSAVYYTTTNGTGQDGIDYQAIHGLISFAPGERTKTIAVPILTTARGNRTVNVNLVTTTANAALAYNNTTATLVIAGDPQTSQIQFSKPEFDLAEAGTGTGVNSITLIRSGTIQAATVYVQLDDGTALYNNDYGIPAETSVNRVIPVEFPRGSATASFNVIVANTFPTPKTFTMRLIASSPGSAPAGQTTATVKLARITQFALSSYPVTSASSTVIVKVVRSGTGTQETVNVETIAGTAVPGVDYTAKSTAITFAAGDSALLVPIEILATTGTTDKTFTVRLSNSSTGDILGPDASVTLSHNPLTPTVQFESSGAMIGQYSQFMLTLVRTGTAGSPTAAVYVKNGTAIDGSDFNVAGVSDWLVSVPFTEGATTASVPILAAGSGLNPKTFSVQLLWMDDGTTVGPRNTFSASIVPNLVQFSPVSYRYASTGTQAVLTLTRTGSAAGEYVVYSTADGSAQAGTDYVATTGTATFAASEMSQPVAIQLLPNATGSTDRSFAVQLNVVPYGATSGSNATVTIAHDPNSPFIQFENSSYSIAPNTTGTVNLVRSGSNSQSSTVIIDLLNGTANNYKVAGGNSDVQVNGSQVTVTFVSGTNSEPLLITGTGGGAGAAFQMRIRTISGNDIIGARNTASVTLNELFQFDPPAPAARSGF